MNLFDVLAVPYAVLTTQATWRGHCARLADLVSLRAGGHVLDLGCGPGESAFGMSGRVPGARITGVDLSRSMIWLAEARKRFEPGSARIDFVRGDALDLPFADDTFDAATGHSFLYLVPDVDRVLAETARVLRPGGQCAFLEPSGPSGLPRRIQRRALGEPRFVASLALWNLMSRRYGRFDEPRFRAAFRRAGLELVGVHETLEGLAMFGVARKPAA